MHLCGVLRVNVGLRAYMYNGHISKGGSLIGHIMLTEVEDHVRRHNRHPERLYMWMDGGGEMANQTVILMTELMVALRLVTSQAWMCRSPRGHGKTDLDGAFGLVSGAILRTLKSKTIDTFEPVIGQNGTSFRETIETNIKNSQVIHIHAILDLDKILEHCKSLIRLAHFRHEENTQHLWRSTAVPISPDFPFGVKTEYKLFPGDITMELSKIEKATASTTLSRRSGIEVVKTYSPFWYPTPTSIPDRNVQGFHLLLVMPSGSDVIPFKPFVPGSRQKVLTFLNCIAGVFEGGSVELQHWSHWCNNVMPIDDNSATFASTHLVPVPFRHIWRNPWGMRNTDCPPAVLNSFSVAQTSLPSDLVAIGMHHVYTSFDGRPGPARLVQYNGAEADRFRAVEERVAASLERKFEVPSALKGTADLRKRHFEPFEMALARRLMQSNREPIPHWSHKKHSVEQLVEVRNVWLQSIMGFYRYKLLSLLQNSDFDAALRRAESNNMTTSELDGGQRRPAIVRFKQPLTNTMRSSTIFPRVYTNFRTAVPLTDETMDTTFTLLAHSDTFAASARFRGREPVNNNEWSVKPSIFVPMSFGKALWQLDFTDCKSILKNAGVERFDQVEYIFAAMREDHADHLWGNDNLTGIIIHLTTTTTTMAYFAPQHCTTDCEEQQSVATLRSHYAALWNLLINAEYQGADKFIIRISDITQLVGDGSEHEFRHIQNDFDAGIAIITAFDFIRNGCPIYLRESDWAIQRKSLGLYVFNAQFPKFV